MKRLSLVLGALLLGLFVAAPTVQAAPAATAFTGEWIGEDPAPPDGDGSTVDLFRLRGRPRGSSPPNEFGTVCEDVGSPVTVFSSMLRGFVDGDTLFALFNVAKCGPATIEFLTGELAIWTLDTMEMPIQRTTRSLTEASFGIGCRPPGSHSRTRDPGRAAHGPGFGRGRTASAMTGAAKREGDALGPRISIDDEAVAALYSGLPGA